MSRFVHLLMNPAALDDCLVLAGPEELVILADAGVALLADAAALASLADRPVAAVAADARARGVADTAGVPLLEDSDWVEQVIGAGQVLSWK